MSFGHTSVVTDVGHVRHDCRICLGPAVRLQADQRSLRTEMSTHRVWGHACCACSIAVRLLHGYQHAYRHVYRHGYSHVCRNIDIDRCTDMCIDMHIDMCTDMCADMCIDVHRHVYGYVCRNIYI